MKLGYTEEFKISLIKADKEIYETYTGELKILFKKPNIKPVVLLNIEIGWYVIHLMEQVLELGH